ncbi:MAG TPA: acyl-CoA reductase [Thermoanaerobaculia bacterium]|nr:acyl-CoA reductase [Thermoanaerobaculia bacterium]
MLAHRRGAAELTTGPQRPTPATRFLPPGLGAPGAVLGPDPIALLDGLGGAGRRALRALPADRRARAWRRALAVLLDPRSAARRGLDPALLAATRLSPPGLQAGLAAIGRGLLGASAEELFAHAAAAPVRERAPPALVVLSANLPGLAMQTVLPALALGRPLVLRSSTREPCFAPALLRALAAEEPALAHAFAALTGPHGDALEDTLLAGCDPVLAYGGRRALDALRRRVAGRLVELGPKLSLALVGGGAGDDEISRLARDVALFDQRGCLSVQLVLGPAPAERVARALVRGLDRQASSLPPGAPSLEESAAVARELDLARLRGDAVIPAAAGAVVIEPADAPLRPAPGGRVVRLRRVAGLDAVPTLLTPWSGLLQGVALAGIDPAQVEPALRGLGVSRVAPAGELQETDARWQNGGVDPLDVL